MARKNQHLMEITVARKDLLKELSAAQGSVERRATIPILSHILLEATGNQLSITATDLNLSLRTACPAQVAADGSCAVPARKFYDYIRLLNDDEINLRVLENDRVEVSCGPSKTRIVGMPKDSFPKLPAFPDDGAIRLTPTTLRTMIGKTQFAISEEESRYTLQGALFLLTPESLTMVATDGHRLAFIETRNGKFPVEKTMRYVIPKKAVSEINSLLSNSDVDVVEFARDDATLFFRVGNRLLTSRQLTGQFPAYENVLPKEHEQSVALPAEQLARAIQRVSQFADERSHSVRFQFEKQRLLINSSSVETGESEDLINTNYAGKTFTMAFNSNYLSDFLKASGAGDVTFSFKASDAPGELQPVESKDFQYRYIVMPMRA